MNEITDEPVPPTKLADPALLDRRFFLRRLRDAAVVGSLAGAWTLFYEPHWLSVEEYDLSVPNLPNSIHGKRLVHISDLHAGRVPLAFLQQAMQKVNALEPDFLVVTGDFVDAGREIAELKEVLQVLQPPKIQSLACLGNHDYGEHYQQVKSADQIQAIAESFGIRVLRNEKLNIAGIDFVGLDDYWSPRFLPERVLKSVTPSRPTVCLCHNPDVCDWPIWDSFKGVILAGHTHGGQCKPPFLPPPILPVLNRRYTQGFFEVGPDRQLYISRGLGYTLRVRFNCRPEITVFRLVGTADTIIKI